MNSDGRQAVFGNGLCIAVAGGGCAEAMCFDFHRVHGLDIEVARIFHAHGRQMRIDDGRRVSNFIVQALRNEPLTMRTDGGQTCSPCCVHGPTG